MMFDVISVVASTASLILAVGAIWLSVVFYRMSSEASRSTTEAAKGIGAIVERLETLFDKLHSDTFSMMRNTVSDGRKHIWSPETIEQEKPVEQVEKKADEKISALKSSMEQQVSEMLQRQKIGEDKMGSIRNEMASLLEKAILVSRQADSEAREETLRGHIMQTIRILTRRKSQVPVDDVVARLSDHFTVPHIVTEVDRMIHDGLIEAESVPLSPNTAVRLPGIRQG